MKTIPILSATVLSLSLLAGCHSASRTEKSAAVGAATGAVIGGVIGNQSGNPRTGAAIGAAAGAVAGGAYGNSQERRRGLSANDTDDYYMSLMTPDEIDILRARARASGRTSYQLTDFLTADERANLRRRDSERNEIGR
ncbi:MAG TPA: YMGG-like glycine zipper-containing protein [Opitutaceae bacterium]|nr:YMGG-like glycine zipper-containing protein [Opitutaceae bacterium]